ncbi:MAG: ATP-binding protein, partial [Treponema sp.]|nr:ATP-binding protein [Treponema sp.]
IAQSQNEIMYIQVSESLKAPETLERELSAFKNIRDSYPRILISMEQDFNKDYDGIRSVYAMDFLTGGAL